MSNRDLKPARPEQMDKIYEIRYKAFLEAGLTQPNPQCRLRDIYDESGFAEAYVLSEGATILGTFRLVRDSYLGLPMDDEGFGQHLDRLRNADRNLAEAGRLAIAPEYQNISSKLSRMLLQHIVKYALKDGFTDVVCMIADHHLEYYKRIFLADEMVSGVKTQYHPNSVGVRLNLDNLVNRYRECRHPKRFKLYEGLVANEQVQATV